MNLYFFLISIEYEPHLSPAYWQHKIQVGFKMSEVQYEYLQMKELEASQHPSEAVRRYPMGDG